MARPDKYWRRLQPSCVDVFRRMPTRAIADPTPTKSKLDGSGTVGAVGSFKGDVAAATASNSKEITELLNVAVVNGVVVLSTTQALPPGPWKPLATKPAAAVCTSVPVTWKCRLSFRTTEFAASIEPQRNASDSTGVEKVIVIVPMPVDR